MSEPTPPTPSVNALTINAATSNLIDSFNVPSGIGIVGQAGGLFDFRLGDAYVAMTALGDILYGGTNGIATRLGGNTTATRKFLRSVGAGGVATAPAWDTVTATDVGSEPALGNPGTSGWILSSTTGGLRSWIAPGGGTSSLTSAHIFVGNASNVATDVALSNDATLDNTGALTIANAAVSLAKMANLAANSLIGNNTASPAAPAALTITNVLDLVGSTRGSIVYRGASAWSALTPGTATWVLTSNGAGADPSWTVAPSGASGANPTASHATNAAINGSAATFMRSDAVPAIATTATLQLGSLCLGTTLVSGHLLDVYAVNSVGFAIGDLPSGTGATFYFYLPTGEIHFYSRKNHPIVFTGYDGANEQEWCRFTIAKNFLIGITNEGGLTGGGGISIGSSTDSSTTGTGSIITAGGMGIAKKLYCSTIYAGATTNLTLNAGTGNQHIVLAPTGTGFLETSSNVLIGDLTANTTTASRLLNVVGSAGVIRAVRTSSGAATVELISRDTVNNTTNIAYWDFYVNSNASNLDDFSLRRRTGGADEQIMNAVAGQFKIVPTGDTTSTTTGSLVTAGGLGIAKALWVGTTARIASTTDATSTTTGAAIISGGLGLAKALWVGGIANITPTARTSGVASYLTITTPADTGQTASTESIGTSFTAATRTWATGALTLQRERVFAAPTYAFAGDSTLTTAINADFADPIAGGHATITNAYSIRAATALVTGVLSCTNATDASAYTAAGVVLSGGLGVAKKIITNSDITTGAPTGGTAAAWKFGIYVATPTVPVGYLQVDVAGTLYEIPAKIH